MYGVRIRIFVKIDFINKVKNSINSKYITNNNEFYSKYSLL